MVIVSRWYGGIKLHGDRFKHISNAGREALQVGGFLPGQGDFSGKGGQRKKPKKRNWRRRKKHKFPRSNRYTAIRFTNVKCSMVSLRYPANHISIGFIFFTFFCFRFPSICLPSRCIRFDCLSRSPFGLQGSESEPDALISSASWSFALLMRSLKLFNRELDWWVHRYQVRKHQKPSFLC